MNSYGDACERGGAVSRQAFITPVRNGKRPVIIATREGEHCGIDHTFEKRTPWSQSESMTGVFGSSTPAGFQRSNWSTPA